MEFIYDADIYKVHLLSSWDGAAVVLDVLTREPCFAAACETLQTPSCTPLHSLCAVKAAIDGQLDPAYQLYSPHLLSLPVKELRCVSALCPSAHFVLWPPTDMTAHADLLVFGVQVSNCCIGQQRAA